MNFFKAQIKKPIHRGKWRLFFGKRYFILKRKAQWAFSGTSYARMRKHEPFPAKHFAHHSLLLRPLKNVDMFLQHNKVTNLSIAISHLDGLIIRPGETFSFWKLVGKPSKAKGYKTGLVLRNGTTAQDTGGGLCQLGNLLFWMVLHSPLTVTERWRHGYDVFPDVNRKVPFGAGATLSYNYIDFQFRNDTAETFQLKLWLSDTHLQGELRADNPATHRYKVEERDHQIISQYWGGYLRCNKIFRQKFDLKMEQLLEEEQVISNQAIMMYDPLLEYKS